MEIALFHLGHHGLYFTCGVQPGFSKLFRILYIDLSWRLAASQHFPLSKLEMNHRLYGAIVKSKFISEEGISRNCQGARGESMSTNSLSTPPQGKCPRSQT